MTHTTSGPPVIGRGSFGEVFLTEFRNTEKEPAEKVVVKRILKMQDEEGTKRLIKEVALMMEYMCFSFLPFGSGSD